MKHITKEATGRRKLNLDLGTKMTDNNPGKSRTLGNSMEAGVSADDYTDIWLLEIEQ